MLTVDILTPEGPVFEGQVDSISLPTMEGEITVLPHHIPLLSVLTPGSILIRQGKEEKLLAVSRGVIEVHGKDVHILADTADLVDALDMDAVEKAKTLAESLVQERRGDEEGFAEAVGILERELARLHTIRRYRTRRSGYPVTETNA